ncbi:hypothetical protein B1M_33767, partial [Burkholderia sp. TJI49]
MDFDYDLFVIGAGS